MGVPRGPFKVSSSVSTHSRVRDINMHIVFNTLGGFDGMVRVALSEDLSVTEVVSPHVWGDSLLTKLRQLCHSYNV